MNAHQFVFVFLAALAGCASSAERPAGLACPTDVLYPMETPAAAAANGLTPYAEMIRATMSIAADRAAAAPAFATFSGGGQWGAYGAGFVDGWNGVDGLPRFQVVTGVSAGALIAPLVFLGPDRIADLRQAFTIKAQSDLVEERGLLALLFGANAMLKRGGLEARLEALVDDGFLTAVANAGGDGERALLIGIVNADDGAFYAVDLVKLAKTRRTDCFRAFLLASTAVPVAFPPVFINDIMYVDGGARQLVFFRETYNALAAMDGGAAASLAIVIDGDLTVPGAKTPNSLLGIAERASSIVVDQIGLESLDRLLRLADERGWQAHYTTARGSPCKIADRSKERTFNAAFMACLMQYGSDRWTAGRPWD